MTPRQVAENYWRIECGRDVEAILGCYEPDAVLVVPGLGRLAGHAEIRRFYKASVDRFPRLAGEIADGVEVGERGAFEWRSVFHDEGGTPYRSKGVNTIHIRNGRFQEVHVYVDPTDLDRPAGSAT